MKDQATIKKKVKKAKKILMSRRTNLSQCKQE